MATYLAVPLKRTWEVDLDKPLRSFISTTYTNASPEDYLPGLQELNRLRNNVINKSVDKHESALEVLYRYHDQLAAIEGKVPITENAVRINFKWQDAFDKQSFLSGKRTLSISSGAYEKVCVLFNIAALQTQIAETQNHTTDDGLKTSAKLFQQAAGILSHLKDCVMSHVQNDPTPDLHPDTLMALSSLMLAQAQDCFVSKAMQDLHPDTLMALSSLMLAQAQDCFVSKAMQDKMKPAIVAKLAFQCSDLYADAMKLLQLDSIRGLWPKDWIPTVASKQAGYHALAEFYQSMISKEKKDFGEEISRLRRAKELMSASESRGGSSFAFADHSRKVHKSLTDANKDNDFIYHAKIPDVNTLSPIGKAAVAKIVPLNLPLSANFKDALEKVVPLAVHQALSGFDARKQDLVSREIGRLRESTQLLNSVLASLNLPAAIEDLSGAKVPPSLLDKASKIRELGGIDTLNRLMSDLPELLTRNREILDESNRMLTEEQQSDSQLRDQFKERWTRSASTTLTEPIRAEGSKYRMILDNATQADGIVKERYGKCRGGVELMSKATTELESALPSGSSAAALQGSAAVQELRGFMREVEETKNVREVLENELKNANCDMSSKFLSALAKDGAISEENLSESELSSVYGDLRRQVTDSVSKQETLLAKIQDSNTRFCQDKAQNQSGASRDTVLRDLAAAFDSFVELKNNLEEGTKFYNDLTQLLVKYQSKVSDFCFARKTEKEELMKDLQTAIVRQPTAAPPATPAYQATNSVDESSNPSVTAANRVPPARPPPPSVPSRQAGAPGPATAPPATPPQPAQPYGYGYPQPGPPPQAPGQVPYPTQGYGGMPYPVYPPSGYVSPPMPTGYNPYGGYPQQGQPQGQYPPQQPPPQGYGAYPGYQQQWPR